MKKINFKKIEKTLNKTMNLFEELHVKDNGFVEIKEITHLYNAGKEYGINIKGCYGRCSYNRISVDGDYETYIDYSSNFDLELDLKFITYDFIACMFYTIISSDEKLLIKN